MRSVPTHLALNPHCSLRLLEEPCVFNKASDELYELDREAFDFLMGLAMGSNSKTADRADKEFLDYCLDEGIVVRGRHNTRRKPPAQSPLQDCQGGHCISASKAR